MLSIITILSTVFVHFLMLMNRTYDGVPKEQYSYQVTEATEIRYFNTFPVTCINIIYFTYFVYVVLFVTGVWKMSDIFCRRQK